jgi:hypothetical protein
MTGLKLLQQNKNYHIGDVRGKGLMVAIEFDDSAPKGIAGTFVPFPTCTYKLQERHLTVFLVQRHEELSREWSFLAYNWCARDHPNHSSPHGHQVGDTRRSGYHAKGVR